MKRPNVSRAVREIAKLPEHRAAILAQAVGRRMVWRDGRRTWARPGDADYPERERAIAVERAAEPERTAAVESTVVGE